MIYYLLGSILAVLILIGCYYEHYDLKGNLKLSEIINVDKSFYINCFIAFIFSWLFIFIVMCVNIYNKIVDETD